MYKIDFVKNILLENSNLSDEKLHAILNATLNDNINFSDLYFQYIYKEFWYLENGIIKNSYFNIDKGVGIRTFNKNSIGFSYSDKISEYNLYKIAQESKNINNYNYSNKKAKIWKKINKQQNLYFHNNPLLSINYDDKINLLKSIESEAKKQDSRVKKVNCALFGSYEIILIISTDGTFSYDIRPLVKLNITVSAEKKGSYEISNYGKGGRKTYDMFLKNNKWKKYTKETVRQAILNLYSQKAPVGEMPVILGPGNPGILIHETVGHGLEYDFNKKKLSIFHNKINTKVATKLCTIVDNATLSNKSGSINIDDEGTKTQCTILIKNGILKSYLQDKFNANITNSKLTGNARRESYAHLPIPRMTNTYLLPGKSSHQDIINSVDHGIYIANLSNGKIDITSDKFIFNTIEAYYIKNGKIKYPIKTIMLIENNFDILKKIIMVGNNLKMDNGIGICSKNDQNIPICVGQPTLLINKITVGGLK
ncbi:MAG: metalloprotease TldD [Candidatus Azosocius agrarius]|nr:MAG: metalloprotease TldD [Gammaproteobacteria bacterium]